jgi:hypothetical protein
VPSELTPIKSEVIVDRNGADMSLTISPVATDQPGTAKRVLVLLSGGGGVGDGDGVGETEGCGLFFGSAVGNAAGGFT